MLIHRFDSKLEISTKKIRDIALNYFDITKKDHFGHSWFFLPDHRGFNLLESQGVPYHSDYALHLNVTAYRTFLVLENPDLNWKLKGPTQEIEPPKPGEICILNVGKPHGVIGLNKHRAPLVMVAWSPRGGTRPIKEDRWDSQVSMEKECLAKFREFLSQVSSSDH